MTTTPFSWTELHAELLEAYPNAVNDGPEAVRLVFVANGTPPVRVGLRIWATTAYGGSFAVVAADLGTAGAFDPRQALDVNAMLVHGALAARAGILELRSALKLTDHDWPSVELAMRVLAAEAAELKSRLTLLPAASARDLGAFSHLTD